MIKVKDFKGNEYTLNLAKAVRAETVKSSHHKKALEFIEEIAPSAPCYNEVTLAGCKGVYGRVLCADIMLPSFSAIIEVHGKQHYEYCQFFHKTKRGFLEYIQNDRIKAEWCELNNFSYLELKFDEEYLWKDQIYESII